MNILIYEYVNLSSANASENHKELEAAIDNRILHTSNEFIKY